jgi:hypothetical protein
LHIQELENENNKVLNEEKQKISEMSHKIDLINTIYECLQDVGTINFNEEIEPSLRNKNVKLAAKSGDATDKSILS